MVRRRPLVMGALAVACLTALLFAVERSVELTRYRLFLAQSRAEAPGTSPRIVRSWAVPFRGRTLALTVTVPAAEVERAGRLDTTWVFGSRGAVRALYVRDVVREEARRPAVDALAAETRRLRNTLGLDADGYLELMVHAVQAVPYGEVGGGVLLPAEVIADGEGVCTDKSVLLGALLLHEGYDTVIWTIDGHDHVAVGVASDGADFRGSGYAFVETTRIAFVGEHDRAFLGRSVTSPAPQMIRIGGTKRYTSGRKAAFIIARLRSARDRAGAVPTPRPAASAIAPEAQAVERARAAADIAWIRAHADDRPLVYQELALPNALPPSFGS